MPDSGELGRLRNVYLNLFAGLESDLFCVAKKVNCSVAETAPLKQRLDELKKAKPSPQLSTAMANKLGELVEHVQEHLRVRNFIVHSTMTVGCVGKQEVALFQNAADQAAKCPIFLAVSAKQFQIYFALLDSFRATAAKILNPPPSQPQPSPAAKAGP